MMYLQVVGGMIVLLAGGDILVRGAVSLAQRLSVSPLIIGLTVVAVGTSAPEFVVSFDAALRGSPAIAVGNVVGSNVANMLLVLGLPAIIRPIAWGPRSVRFDNAAMILASVLFAVFCLSGVVERWQGLVLFALLLAYLGWCYRSARADNEKRQFYADEVAEFEDDQRPLWRSTLYVLAGLAGLIIGGDVLIDGAVTLARTAGISEAVIGLTLIAVGTSLPELVTSLIAVIRGHGELAIGNVLGSNMFNVLGVIGATAAIVPLQVPAEVLDVDLWIMLGCVALLIPYLMRHAAIGRWSGVAFLAGYVVFVLAQFHMSGDGAWG